MSLKVEIRCWFNNRNTNLQIQEYNNKQMKRIVFTVHFAYRFITTFPNPCTIWIGWGKGIVSDHSERSDKFSSKWSIFSTDLLVVSRYSAKDSGDNSLKHGQKRPIQNLGNSPRPSPISRMNLRILSFRKGFEGSKRGTFCDWNSWESFGFFWKKLHPPKFKYGSCDWKLLAIDPVIKEFCHMAKKFVIFLNHKPLTFAFYTTRSISSSRLHLPIYHKYPTCIPLQKRL